MEAVEPAAALEPPAQDVGLLEEWTGRAIGSRPEIEAAGREAEAARAAAEGSRAVQGPEVAGMARYERNASELEAGEGSYLVGLSLRWSQLDPGRGARGGSRAAGRRAVEDGGRLEVERAFRDMQVADRGLAAAREAVAASEAARRITSDRYAAGLLPITDLLAVETDLAAARLGELAARYDAVLGRVRLRRAAGRIEVQR